MLEQNERINNEISEIIKCENDRAACEESPIPDNHAPRAKERDGNGRLSTKSQRPQLVLDHPDILPIPFTPPCQITSDPDSG